MRIERTLVGTPRQAVAEEDGRGGLRMHYTGVPNIQSSQSELFEPTDAATARPIQMMSQ